MGLTIEQLQQACENRTGKDYPHCSKWGPDQWAVALIGEVGEAANFQKKYNRGTISKEEFTEAVGKELADTIMYLVLWAGSVGIRLEDVTIDKYNEVSERVNSAFRLEKTLDKPVDEDKINAELREVAELFDAMMGIE